MEDEALRDETDRTGYNLDTLAVGRGEIWLVWVAQWRPDSIVPLV